MMQKKVLLKTLMRISSLLPKGSKANITIKGANSKITPTEHATQYDFQELKITPFVV